VSNSSFSKFSQNLTNSPLSNQKLKAPFFGYSSKNYSENLEGAESEIELSGNTMVYGFSK